MTALGDRLAGAEDHPLVIAPSGVLSAGVARRSGPAEMFGPGDTVLVSIEETCALARTLAALDGRVAALLLVSTGQDARVVRALAAAAGARRIVSDRAELAALPGALRPEDALGPPRPASAATTWMMTTSGTTGIPKIVPHSLASLSRTVRRDPLARAPVWGLVYEMTRFAGLQVALQSLIGGGTIAAPDLHAPLADQLGFLAKAGTSHLSATPTLWRRLLMAPEIGRLKLRQATLGGEIADQAVLDAVAARFPETRLTHIYASTEAGVGFAVNDRRAGFPLAYTDDAPGGVGIKIEDGLLWLRPPDGRVLRYLGGQKITVDGKGYVLTGDRIEISDNRALFLGRDSGVVNVGGVKIYPERVERILAAIPGVGLARVGARKSPITGALLVATVVPDRPGADEQALKAEILARCRAELEREAVPARITFVEDLDINPAGKISRI